MLPERGCPERTAPFSRSSRASLKTSTGPPPTGMLSLNLSITRGLLEIIFFPGRPLPLSSRCHLHLFPLAENSLFSDGCTDGVQGSLQYLHPYLHLRLVAVFRDGTDGVRYRHPLDYPVGSNGEGDARYSRDQGCWYPGSFDLPCERCAATRAGASSGGHHYTIDPFIVKHRRDLAPISLS